MNGTKVETMGMRIKKRRAVLGMTQEDLAEAMCLPKTTISTYENDRVDVRGSVISELSECLRTTPNYLLMGWTGTAEKTDPYLEEMTNMLGMIADPKVREVLAIQVCALVG